MCSGLSDSSLIRILYSELPHTISFIKSFLGITRDLKQNAISFFFNSLCSRLDLENKCNQIKKARSPGVLERTLRIAKTQSAKYQLLVLSFSLLLSVKTHFTSQEENYKKIKL